ncbi:MAG: hypothetical protein AB7L76_20305 [Burkholderiaceae bacterium]
MLRLLLALTAVAVVGSVALWFFKREPRYLRWAKLSFVAGIIALVLFFAALITERLLNT